MDKLTPVLTLPQLKQNIDALRKQGVATNTIQSYVDNYQSGAGGTYSLKTPPVVEKPNFTTSLGQDLQKRVVGIEEGVRKGIDLAGRAIQSRGQQAKVETAGQVLGGILGATVATPIAESIGGLMDVLKNIGNQAPESVRKPIVDSLKAGFQTLAERGPQFVKPEEVGILMNKYEEAKKADPAIARDLEAAGNLLFAAFSLSDIKAGTEGLASLPGKVKGVVGDVSRVPGQILEAGTDLVKNVTGKVPQYADRATQWLASEPSAQIKTILQETPKSKFDEFLKVAEEASIDPRKPSVFEKVGEKLSDATKQLKKQASSIGAQKSAIIEKAKVGLEEFKDAPRRALLQVMKLEKSPVKDQIIAQLKGIKTKLDADKAIDAIQSMLYDARGTKLIAEGSKMEKQLQGIIGEMNNALKESLPQAYRDLNAKFANRIKVVGTLNRALGEVVEGVPTRGASLIKQFFSPAGSKTKELFEFVKKTTGVDLAQETTLAKFMGEMFNDPKVKSLLENIPLGRQGVIREALNFVAEKTGIGKDIRESIRSGSIEKAREVTGVGKESKAAKFVREQEVLRKAKQIGDPVLNLTDTKEVVRLPSLTNEQKAALFDEVKTINFKKKKIHIDQKRILNTEAGKKLEVIDLEEAARRYPEIANLVKKLRIKL